MPHFNFIKVGNDADDRAKILDFLVELTYVLHQSIFARSLLVGRQGLLFASRAEPLLFDPWPGLHSCPLPIQRALCQHSSDLQPHLDPILPQLLKLVVLKSPSFSNSSASDFAQAIRVFFNFSLAAFCSMHTSRTCLRAPGRDANQRDSLRLSSCSMPGGQPVLLVSAGIASTFATGHW